MIAALALAGGAAAQQRIVDVDIQAVGAVAGDAPQAAQASYARTGLPNTAAFRVTVRNDSGNTINRVSLRATSLIAAGRSAPFLGELGGLCQPDAADPNSAVCEIGQLRAEEPGRSASFLLFYALPAAPALPAAEQVALRAVASYSDSSNGEQPDATPVSSAFPQVVALSDDAAANQFRGVIQPTGRKTLFTGGGNVATAQDPYVTIVEVPAFDALFGGDYTASISETETRPVATGDTWSLVSALRIPGLFAQELRITLRRDVTTLSNLRISKPGRFIDTGGLRYQADDALVPSTVLKCSVSGGPKPKEPCVDDADPRGIFEFGRRDGVEAQGDWQFIIRAVDNGRYIN